MPAVLFLLDENVPASLGAFLTARSHECLRVQDVLTAGAADKIVHETANDLGAILVTWNAKDFIKPASKYPNAGLLFFRCAEVDGCQRLMETLDLVEYEWNLIQAMKSQPWPFIIDVGVDVVRILHRKMDRTPKASDSSGSTVIANQESSNSPTAASESEPGE